MLTVNRIVVIVVIVLMVADSNLADNTEPTDEELAYLRKYQYILPPTNDVVAHLAGDEHVRQAICRLQRFFDLEVTCEMNDETRDLMRKARCGVPDVVINATSANYVLHGTRWTKTHLTWQVSEYTNKLNRNTTREAITYSLNVWAAVSGLTFQYKEHGNVDMEIGFYSRSHLNEEVILDFDGPSGVLAHAYFPKYGGDTHLDADEMWARYSSYSDTPMKSLVVVMVHEFGHALGLSHASRDLNSIMRPVYPGWANAVTLSEDDINGIRRLYGNTGDQMPTAEPDIDIFCQDLSVDVIFEYNRNSYFAFKGKSVRYIPLRGLSRTMPVDELFKGTLSVNSKIDAALNMPGKYGWKNVNGRWHYRLISDPVLYLFQGYKVHSFKVRGVAFVETSVDYISNKFQGIPGYIDSAFTWSGNNRIYFTKNDKYYRVVEYSSSFLKDYGYPKPLSIWRGLPRRLDASLYMRRFGVTVFFSGGEYYLFNDNIFSVAPNYPRPVATDWFGCSESGRLDVDSEAGLQPAVARITDHAPEVADARLAAEAPPLDGSKPTTVRAIVLREPQEKLYDDYDPNTNGSAHVKISITLKLASFIFFYFY